MTSRKVSIVLLTAQCFAAASVAVAATPEHPPGKMTEAQIVQDLGSYLKQEAAADRFSGAVLLAKGDKILFEQAYGFASHAFNAPNKVDTRFNLGSMNKMFTGVSIMQLVQQGKLSVDDTVAKLLPDYPDKDIAAKITVYHLLTHTSGLPDIFNERFMDTPKDKLVTLEAWLPLFTGKPLLFEPGAKWSYCSSEYILLGLIIQRISAESYNDYIRDHIFKPAGMAETHNYQMHDDVPNLAVGYLVPRGPARSPREAAGSSPSGLRRTNSDILSPGSSAGGGYSTIADVLKFARALQEHKLLDPEHTQLLTTGKVAEGGNHGTMKYGFGMEEDFINGVRMIGHNGGGPGIGSQLDMYPDLGYTVVVMTNDGSWGPVIHRLRSELTGQGLPQTVH